LRSRDGLRGSWIGTVSIATKKVAYTAMGFLGTGLLKDCASCTMREGMRFGVLVGILLSLVHLLLERFGLLLVDKGQTGKTFWILQFKGMEESSVLIILESIIYLLIPEHASAGRGYVNQFNPEGVSNQII
jgi:hypothetical protein